MKEPMNHQLTEEEKKEVRRIMEYDRQIPDDWADEMFEAVALIKSQARSEYGNWLLQNISGGGDWRRIIMQTKDTPPSPPEKDAPIEQDAVDRRAIAASFRKDTPKIVLSNLDFRTGDTTDNLTPLNKEKE